MKKIKKILSLFLFTIVSLLPIGSSAAASSTSNGLGELVQKSFQQVADASGLRTGTESDKLTPLELFGLYLSISLGFIGVLFIVQVIHGGILWMTAGGNEEQITQARQKMTNASIGAAIMFASYIFTYFVLSKITSTLGVSF